MKTLKLSLVGVAAAAVVAFAASLHGTKSVGEGDPTAKAAPPLGPTAPPRPEAPSSEAATPVAETKATEVAKSEAPAESKIEPGAEPYAVLPDGTRYYWVKGATKDASGNWVPHVFHVAAQPIELDGVEVVRPGASGSSAGSPR
ncbi:MAG: hypothetical protein L0323_06535 [Planctomycetes bacterium]|nr:hypothetical protein [Planctomycetota bacterium]